MIIDDHADFTRHEIRNAVLQLLGAAPGAPSEGLIYGLTTTHRPQYFDGTTFKPFLLLGDVVGNGGDVTQASASGGAGRLKVSAGADKSIQDYSAGAGLIKADASGVASVATVGTDYVTAASTNTFTNKTFDAAGAGNTLTNISVAMLGAGAVNSSALLAGATNSQLPTALAVKTYADNLLAANDAQILKGGIDASTSPNYPAADAGHTYRITVGGLIGGASGVAVQAGDSLTCYVDATLSGTQAAVGANWAIVQANLDQATTTVQGATRYATNAEVLAKAVATAAVTPASLAGFVQTKPFTFGDATATTFTLTHNLNTFEVITQVRDATTNEVRYPKIVNATLNTVTISGYLAAPALNSMKAVVQG
jgi:hypothetical protein